MREVTVRGQKTPLWKVPFVKKGGYKSVDYRFVESVRWDLPLEGLAFVEVSGAPEGNSAILIQYGPTKEKGCNILLASQSEVMAHMMVLSAVPGFTDLPQSKEIFEYIHSCFDEFKRRMELRISLGVAPETGLKRIRKAVSENQTMIKLYNSEAGTRQDFVMKAGSVTYGVEAISGVRGTLMLLQALSMPRPDKQGWSVENPPYGFKVAEAAAYVLETEVTSWFIGLDLHDRTLGFYVLPCPSSVNRAKRLVDIFFTAEKLDKGPKSKYPTIMDTLDGLVTN